MVTRTDSTIDRTTAIRGAVSGAVAFLLGYVLTYAWRAPSVEESLRAINAIAELAGGAAIPTWKAVGWLYFNAHVVATRVPAIAGGDRMVDFIRASDDGSLVLLYALVPVLIVLAGAAVARYSSADRLADAAAKGATVVVGYFPVAVVVAFLVGHTIGGDVRIAPDLVTAIVLAGVVYPAFFGAVGGAVGHWLGRVTRS